MRTNMTRSLFGKLSKKEYREAFVDSTIGNVLSAQIFSIRKRLGWNQAELASRCDMAQARISLMENPDYQNFSLKTLKRLAAAFDVALLVRFVPYSELVRWTENETQDTIAVPTYTEDAASEAASGEHVRFAPYRKEANGSVGRPVFASGAERIQLHLTGDTTEDRLPVVVNG